MEVSIHSADNKKIIFNNITVKQILKYSILAITFLISFIFSIATYINPIAKWQILKSTVLTLESELFKFRTQSGK